LTISDAEGFIQAGGIASVALKQTGLTEFTVAPDVNKEVVSRHEWDFKMELFTLLDKYGKIK
jgi:hypothetical protein